MKKSKKILIIGGCGYLGSQLFQYLKKSNLEVDTLDLELYGNKINSKNIKKDFKLVTKNFLENYESIVLLAGHSTVKICSEDPLGAFENNVKNFFDLIKKIGSQKLIYASSYRVYGSTGKIRFTEKSKIALPSNYYDLTKVTIDHYAALSGVRYYSLRMATVNGFSPNLRTNQIINKLFILAKQNKKLEVYDSSSRFSVLGINDFCRAVEVIIMKNKGVGVYNLSSFDTSIRKICEKINLLVSKQNSVKYKRSPLDIQTSLIQNLKFKREFDFDFEDTLNNIIENLNSNYSSANYLIDEY